MFDDNNNINVKSLFISDKGKENHIRNYEVKLIHNGRIKVVIRRYKSFYLLDQILRNKFFFIGLPTFPEKSLWKKLKAQLNPFKGRYLYLRKLKMIEFYMSVVFDNEILSNSEEFLFFFNETKEF